MLVTYATSDGAEAAVSALDGKVWHDAQIQLSLHSPHRADKKRNPRATPQPQSSAPSSDAAPASAAPAAEASEKPSPAVESTAGDAKKATNDAAEVAAEFATAPSSSVSAAAVATASGDAATSAPAVPASTGSTATRATATAGRPSRRAPPSRAPREPKPATGEASDTMLFVSHLSYSVTSKTLMEFFAPYEVKSAHVVRKREHPRQSRGFAFVNFASHEMQQKALSEKQGAELHGRAMRTTGT